MAVSLLQATGALLEQILDETHPLWGEGLDRDAYGRYNLAQQSTTWGTAHLRRVALTDGARLLATAKRYDLRVRLDGRELGLMGIGAVYTPARLRGRGHATELIRQMLQSAADEGLGLAALFSEIDPRYYERLGFLRLPINQVALGARAVTRPGAPAIPMRSGTFADLPAIAGMNAMQSEHARFALTRSADYARQAITKKRLLAACGRPGHRQVEFFVVEEGGGAAAYIVLLQAGDFWMVTECGDRDPSGARVGAMLLALLAREAGREIRLRAWLPPAFLPPQLEILARETPPITMMLRPLGRQTRPDPPLGPGDIVWWHADAF
jgi:GNAT superfamily N-acetyltransferase